MPEKPATGHLRVALGERSYDIYVGERLMNKAGDYIAPLLKGKNVIVISDRNVARFYLHRLCNALEEAGINHRSVIIQPGEATKSLSAFGDLMEALLEQKPDRKTTLIALGGGVVGDLTGFAASVLLRGVEFIQIPTTLLAQVDSSVGGKTGINSRFGKNLIGSFHQPLLVLADVATLSTLPPRELLAGYAETLKYGLISDVAFFEWLEKNGAKLIEGDSGLQTEAIIKSCAAKADIVAKDEKESGVRALLNFGHTFGHALESEMGYGDTLLHGEAVAIGMMMAFQASVKMGICPKQDLDRVLTHYEATGLCASPRAIAKKWKVDNLMKHFAHDKKTESGKLTFILVRGVGKAFIQSDVDKHFIRELLVELCQA